MAKKRVTLASVLRPWWGWMPLMAASAVISSVAAVQSFSSPDEEPWLWWLLSAPGIATVPYVCAPLFWRNPTTRSITGRLLRGALVMPLPMTVVVAVVVGVHLANPDVREVIAATVALPGYGTWEAGLGAGISATAGGTLIGGMLTAIGAVLLVLMPGLAIRAPHALTGDSAIETVQHRSRALVTRLLYFGLGPLLVGVALVMAEGDDTVTTIGWVLTLVAGCAVGAALMIVAVAKQEKRGSS